MRPLLFHLGRLRLNMSVEAIDAFAKEVEMMATEVYTSLAPITAKAVVSEAAVALMPGCSKEIVFPRKYQARAVDVAGVEVLAAQALIHAALKPITLFKYELNITVDHDKRECVYTATFYPACRCERKIFAGPRAPEASP